MVSRDPCAFVLQPLGQVVVRLGPRSQRHASVASIVHTRCSAVVSIAQQLLPFAPTLRQQGVRRQPETSPALSRCSVHPTRISRHIMFSHPFLSWDACLVIRFLIRMVHAPVANFAQALGLAIFMVDLFCTCSFSGSGDRHGLCCSL